MSKHILSPALGVQMVLNPKLSLSALKPSFPSYPVQILHLFWHDGEPISEATDTCPSSQGTTMPTWILHQGAWAGGSLWALAHHSSEAQILCTEGLDSQLITPRTRRAPSQRGSHWPLHRRAMLWDAEGSSCLRTHWNVFLVKQKGGEALGLKREARILLPQQKWLYKGRILHDSGSNSQIAGIFFFYIYLHTQVLYMNTF